MRSSRGQTSVSPRPDQLETCCVAVAGLGPPVEITQGVLWVVPVSEETESGQVVGG